MHPGGGYVLDGNIPRAVSNAAVLGVRTVLTPQQRREVIAGREAGETLTNIARP